ncbi:MAG: hypothetical protein RQ875_06605 [Vicingaceae bacterium]|nr:hypothetical protein [Vicingaceae bacterium]
MKRYKGNLKELDHILIGLVLGLLLPYIMMYFWLQTYSNLSLFEIIKNPFFSEIVNVLKSSIFSNLALFFLFYWFKKDFSAKGVIFATLVYGAFYVFYIVFI